MKLNKEKFLKTELGQNLKELVTSWDKALNTISCRSGCSTFTDEYRRASETEKWCQAQWKVYQIMLKQFYNVEYHFSRTDDFCGIVTDIEYTDILFKVERKGSNK